MDIVFWLILLFVLFDLVIVGWIFFFRKRAFDDNQRRYFLERWKAIQAESDNRHKVMEADKLIDKVLSKKGYSGPLGEKLKRSGKLFSDIDGLWAAHKLRNRLAHEFDVKINDAVAAKAMSSFKMALKDLDVIK